MAEVEATHAGEPHSGGLANRLNWLRAGVLGANDGIVSVSAIAVGGGSHALNWGPSSPRRLQVWWAARFRWLGEYVSVSSQRDSERALIAKEEAELATMPYEELAELTKLYQDKGLSPQTARQVAEELTATDALAAHLDAELNIDQDDIVSSLASRVRLGHRLSDRRAAANSGDHPVSRHDSNSGNVCRRAGCLGDTGAAGGYLGGSPILGRRFGSSSAGRSR